MVMPKLAPPDSNAVGVDPVLGVRSTSLVNGSGEVAANATDALSLENEPTNKDAEKLRQLVALDVSAKLKLVAVNNVPVA